MIGKIQTFKTKHPKLAYYIAYTVLFLIMFEVCYGIYFQLAHKSFIWEYDGLEISYPSFVYFGRWFRKLLKNIFVKHKFLIPMWDMSMGYGSDTSIFVGSAYKDPFMLLSVICPSKYSEAMYDFVLILKMYCAGVTFSMYARYRGNNNLATLAGALIYTFSGPMYIVFRQYGFVSIFIDFPLLMLGVECIWEGRKPFLYIIILTYMMSVNSYFTYMSCIFIFCYCIIRYIDEHKKYDIKHTLRLVLKYLIFSSISILYGFLVNYTYIKSIAGLGRLNLDYYIPAFYNKEYNINIYSGFITAFDGGNDWVIGFSVIVLISMFAVLVDKKLLKEKIILILMTASVFLPFVGHVFNGFKYATNRWIWGYDFFVAYLIVIMAGRLRELSNKRIAIITLFTCIYVIALVFIFKVYDGLTIVIAVFAIMICLLMFIFKYIPKKSYNMLYLWLVMISLIPPSYYWFSLEKPDSVYMERNLPHIEVDKDAAYTILVESGGKFLLDSISPDTLIRYDSQNGSKRNSSIMYSLSGINFYSSLYNNDIDDFHNNIALASSGVVHSYNGLDKRSTLEYLMGVNYCIFEYDEYVPYGYDSACNWGVSDYYDEGYYMAERSNAASMIYAFDRKISTEDYERLDAYQKQKALMYGLVIDSEEDNRGVDIDNIEEIIGNDSVNYEISDFYGLEYKGNKIEVYEEKAYMYLNINAVNNCELYVLINHLMLNDTDKTSFGISVEAFNDDNKLINKYYNIYTPSYHMYGGKDKKLVNLEGVYEGANRIKISFNTLGTYSIEDIKVYAESFDDIDSQINGIKKCSVGETFSDNEIKASIQLDKDEYVFISVPYAEGWTAYIDGEKTDIYKADDAFMAIKASKGIHNLRLKYKTPHIGLSLVLWGIYVVAVIVLVVRRCKR